MKDIIIPAKIIKAELRIALIIWLIANLINIFSIWKYDTNWFEIVSFQPMVLFLTLIFYVVVLVVRGVIYLAKTVVCKKTVS